jgi:hypothetical protein
MKSAKTAYKCISNYKPSTSINKMILVNPKTVMESTHTLPEKSSQPGYVPFNKVQYIISTQKVEDNGYVSLNISWHYFNKICNNERYW